MNNNESFKLKAIVASHVNEDRDNEFLLPECCMCPLLGIPITQVISPYNRWRLIRIDVKTAFLQTGPASGDVYVIPPREYSFWKELWLLLVATYGLVNWNAK